MSIEELVQPFIKISDDIAFNPTLAIQLVIFLALYFILKPLLWEPMLAVLDKRRALTEGQKEQADAEEAEILALQETYAVRIKETRQAAADERAKTRAAAQESAKAVLEKARAEAARTITHVRGEVAAATEQARAKLRTEAETTAKAMTEKLLGRSV